MGCKYSFTDNRYPGRAIAWINWDESDVPDRENKRDIEILGRDIYIGDILSAIDKIGKFLAIDSRGRLNTKVTAKSDYHWCNFDLEHSLAWHKENKPEVIEFLYDILPIKK